MQSENEMKLEEDDGAFTFDNKEHMEDAIACITSTAEPTASLTSSISPCWKDQKNIWC